MLYKLKKVFNTNGFSLSIKARPKVLWWITFLFSVAFLKNAKLTLIKNIFVTMSFWKMFTNSLICVFSNAWMKMSGYVANINHITQITGKFINNVVLTHNTMLKALLQFSAHKNTGRL